MIKLDPMTGDPDVLVLIDESGEPGFGKHSDPIFAMVASVVYSDSQKLIKITESVKKDTRKTKRKASGELKYFTSSDEIRTEIVREMASLDIKVYCVYVDKSKGRWNAQTIYHSATKQLLDTILSDISKRRCSSVDIIFDKCNYLKEEDARKFADKACQSNHVNSLRAVKCVSSVDDKRLQCHDIITGTLGRFAKDMEPFEDYRILESKAAIIRVVPKDSKSKGR